MAKYRYCIEISDVDHAFQTATARNKEGDTSLAFLVNNSRWIKLTASQKLGLTKYGNLLFGQDTTFTFKRELGVQPETSRPAENGEIMAEINITGVTDASMLESNLLAQLDDISSSFRSIVDTLTALERRCSPEDAQQQSVQTDSDETAKPVENEASPSGNDPTAAAATDSPAVTPDLMSFPPTVAGVPDDLISESLPVLIQLTQSWPSVASTVLGYYPMGTSAGGSDVDMPEEPKGFGGSLQKGPSRSGSMESCSLDSFVFELLSHADEAVLVSFVETIITEMNKHPQLLTLDAVHRISELHIPPTARDVAMMVGIKFLRSVIRQLAVHLSRSGLSYVDLRTRLGSSPSASNVRNAQSDNVEFKRKVR